MSGVWRKGACVRCMRIGYVHVAAHECWECMRAQKLASQLDPDGIAQKIIDWVKTQREKMDAIYLQIKKALPTETKKLQLNREDRPSNALFTAIETLARIVELQGRGLYSARDAETFLLLTLTQLERCTKETT